MTRRSLFAVATSATVLALLAACGTDTVTTVTVCPDAGVLDSSVQNVVDAGEEAEAAAEAGPPDAGPDYAPATTTLRPLGATDAFWLVGITSGPTPHAIYYVQTADNFALKAIPVAGGPEIVLDPDLDPFIVNDDKANVVGGAVAWSEDGDTNNIASSLFVWTALNGVKKITTNTYLTQFWATEDGSQIAFSANAVAQGTTDLVVTTSAAPDITTPVITGANAENITVNTDACPTQFGFAGTTFIASYCTGNVTTATQEQLVTVDTTVKPLAAIVRVGNTNTTDAYNGAFLTDNQGKNFVVANSGLTARVIATNGATTTVGSIGTIQGDAMVVPDGSFVLYRNPANTLSKATFAATPGVTSLGANIGTLVQITNDSKTALYSTDDLSLGSGDLNAIDITSATPNPTPVPLVITPTALLAGITGDNSRAVYYEGNADGTFALSTVALTGGAPLLLHASTESAILAQTGTGVLSLFDETPILHSDTATRIDVSYIDAAKGGLLEKPNPSILDAQDAFTITGKTFVYRDIGASPGIYALDLP